MPRHCVVLSVIFRDSTTAYKNAPQVRRVKCGELKNKRERITGLWGRYGR
jgi:hypothetical protein